MDSASQKALELLISAILASYLPPATSAETSEVKPKSTIPSVKVLAVGEFKRGETCIDGFKRIGYKITVKQCIDASNEAGVTPPWSRPQLGKEPVIIVPVQQGDPFAVIKTPNGATKFVLFNKKK
jgi:hypothetical protein